VHDITQGCQLPALKFCPVFDMVFMPFNGFKRVVKYPSDGATEFTKD
tara:strand:- start:97 stop:237 length:141 start_codon:yes stop_codon:yes gene_type:complete